MTHHVHLTCPCSSKAITTTAAPYLRISLAFAMKSASPSFRLMLLTTHLPCVHLRPDSITAKFDESMHSGTCSHTTRQQLLTSVTISSWLYTSSSTRWVTVHSFTVRVDSCMSHGKPSCFRLQSRLWDPTVCTYLIHCSQLIQRERFPTPKRTLTVRVIQQGISRCRLWNKWTFLDWSLHVGCWLHPPFVFTLIHMPAVKTRKPSWRWQTRVTRKHAKIAPNRRVSFHFTEFHFGKFQITDA